MSITLWTVWGESGEYDEYSRWLDSIWTTPEAAKERKVSLESAIEEARRRYEADPPPQPDYDTDYLTRYEEYSVAFRAWIAAGGLSKGDHARDVMAERSVPGDVAYDGKYDVEVWVTDHVPGYVPPK